MGVNVALGVGVGVGVGLAVGVGLGVGDLGGFGIGAANTLLAAANTTKAIRILLIDRS